MYFSVLFDTNLSSTPQNETKQNFPHIFYYSNTSTEPREIAETVKREERHNKEGKDKNNRTFERLQFTHSVVPFRLNKSLALSCDDPFVFPGHTRKKFRFVYFRNRFGLRRRGSPTSWV